MIKRIARKRAETAFVRIAGLIAAGHDRVRRHSAGAQNRGVDFRAQNFRGQVLPDQFNFFPVPGFDAFRTSMPRASFRFR